MRYLFIVLFFGAPALAASPSDPVDAAQAVQQQSFQNHMHILAGEQPIVQGTNLFVMDRFARVGMTLARYYLYNTIHDLGIQNISLQTFSLKVSRRSQTIDGVNFIFEIPGAVAPNEVIMIGAHYDTTGRHEPGADDNASGVAALLSIAEAIQKRGIRPDRTIRFGIFDAEEIGMVGSRLYFDGLTLQQESVHLFINLDMLTYSPGGYPHLLYDTNSNGSIEQLVKGVMTESGQKIKMNPYRGFVSDNVSSQAVGVPTVSISEWATERGGKEGRDYPYVHTPADRIDKINISYGTELVRYAAALTVYAADTTDRWETQQTRRDRDKASEWFSRNGTDRKIIVITDPAIQAKVLELGGAANLDSVVAKERAEAAKKQTNRVEGDWGRRLLDQDWKY